MTASDRPSTDQGDPDSPRDEVRGPVAATGDWALAQSGDNEARARLIERACHSNRRRLGALRTHDRDDALQEIASSILRALETGLAPESNLDAFLEWRGRGEITRILRRRAKERAVSLDEAYDLVGPEDSPFRKTKDHELRTAIEACAESIPNAKHRQAWQRRHLRGEDAATVAAALGVSPVLVRTWTARANRTVRTCLERRLGDQKENR